MPYDPVREELSPDGRTLVRWVETDGRMSHVIRTPEILDAASGETILRFRDSGFDGAIIWGENGGFEIDLRHYWRSGNLRLAVDRAAGTFRTVGGDEKSPPHPLGKAGAFVEAYFKAADREAARSATDLSLEERLERQLRGGTRALWAIATVGLGVTIWALFFRH